MSCGHSLLHLSLTELTIATQCSMHTSALVIRRLQMVLSAAARFVVGLGKYEHTTPVLRDVLHWLPMPQRIPFKIAALTFDCVRGIGPAYFSSIVCTVADNPGRTGLHSAEHGDLFVPRTRTTRLGRRSFFIAAPDQLSGTHCSFTFAPRPSVAVSFEQGSSFQAGLSSDFSSENYWRDWTELNWTEQTEGWTDRHPAHS